MPPVRLLIFLVVTMYEYLDYAAGALAHQLPAEKPAELADIPGCYFTSLNIVLPYGDTYPEGQCAKYTCAPSGDIDVMTCGVVRAGPGYRIVTDPSLQYPDCCPKIECGDAVPFNEAVPLSEGEDHKDAVLMSENQDHKDAVLLSEDKDHKDAVPLREGEDHKDAVPLTGGEDHKDAVPLTGGEDHKDAVPLSEGENHKDAVLLTENQDHNDAALLSEDKDHKDAVKFKKSK